MTCTLFFRESKINKYCVSHNQLIDSIDMAYINYYIKMDQYINMCQSIKIFIWKELR